MKVKVVSSCVLLMTGSSLLLQAKVHAKESTERIEIVAKRFEYAPQEINVKLGAPVTISLSAKDVDHGLKFSDVDLEMLVKKGETKEVTFMPDKAGDFVGQCSSFCGAGHGTMKLTMHVTE